MVRLNFLTESYQYLGLSRTCKLKETGFIKR